MAAPQPPSGISTFRNPDLTATITADSEALRNDLEQAQELAAEYQRQLASKTNDYGELSRLFQKTMEDFTHLQGAVTELREERHRLANAAMRGTAFERQLKIVTDERNRLIQELRELKRAIESPAWLEARLQQCLTAESAPKATTDEPQRAPQGAVEPPADSANRNPREFISLSFDESSDSEGVSVSF